MLTHVVRSAKKVQKIKIQKCEKLKIVEQCYHQNVQYAARKSAYF